MPETRRQKTLIKQLDSSKIVVIFPHVGFKKWINIKATIGLSYHPLELKLAEPQLLNKE